MFRELVPAGPRIIERLSCAGFRGFTFNISFMWPHRHRERVRPAPAGDRQGSPAAADAATSDWRRTVRHDARRPEACGRRSAGRCRGFAPRRAHSRMVDPAKECNHGAQTRRCTVRPETDTVPPARRPPERLRPACCAWRLDGSAAQLATVEPAGILAADAPAVCRAAPDLPVGGFPVVRFECSKQQWYPAEDPSHLDGDPGDVADGRILPKPVPHPLYIAAVLPQFGQARRALSPDRDEAETGRVDLRGGRT